MYFLLILNYFLDSLRFFNAGKNDFWDSRNSFRHKKNYFSERNNFFIEEKNYLDDRNHFFNAGAIDPVTEKMISVAQSIL
ncbi:MAG TPA: hypothetical protein DDW50_08385 [Firmicutes bacterium]|nr:hypothetical protein [Bacillota bacterium]